MTTSKSKIALFFALICTAIFFSTYQLTESPPVWYDEGFYVQTAFNLAATGTAGLELSPNSIAHISHLTVGYPLIYLLALVAKVFGTTIAVGRALMALFIVIFVLASFVLLYNGRKNALWGLLLLVTFPPLYANGKSVLGEVPGLLFVVLGLIGLQWLRSLSQYTSYWAFFSGMFFGLAAATKPLYLLVLPAVVFSLACEWYLRRTSKQNILLVLTGIFAPLCLWFVIQFGANDTLSDILGFYANPYEIPHLIPLIFSNIRTFLTSVGPLYLLGLLLVWFGAIFLRLKRKEGIQAEEIVSFTFSLLVTGAFFRTAGWFRYLFEAQVIALLYFPSSFEIVLDWCKSKISFIQKIPLSIFKNSFPVLLALFGMYQLLFSSWVADSYTSKKTAFWVEYFEKVPPSEILFFYDVPEVALFARQGSYYQYINPAGGPIGKEYLVIIEEGIADRVILETDALKGREVLFKKYSVDEETYKYTILQKKK